MTARPITIMIIDDHVVIRSGLRMLRRPAYEGRGPGRKQN